MVYLQLPTQFRQKCGHERDTLIGQNLLWVAHVREQELLGTGFRGGFTQWDGLRVSGGIVHDDHHILVTLGGLWEEPHQVYSHLLKWDIYDG